MWWAWVIPGCGTMNWYSSMLLFQGNGHAFHHRDTMRGGGIGSYVKGSRYLPTSGDLKSGLSILHYIPQPPNVNSTNTPTPPRQKIALGHYMMSYMMYMGSKCTFIIVMTN